MNETKEFLGKNLDDAIAEACKFYDASRDQLEIEIIEDAKSGIFGLVGARKAKIVAKRVAIPDLLQSRKTEKFKQEVKTKKDLKPRSEFQPEEESSNRQEKTDQREDRPVMDDKMPRALDPKNQNSKGHKKENVDPSVAKTQREVNVKITTQPPEKSDDNKKNVRITNGKGKKIQPQTGEQQNEPEDNPESDIQDSGFPKIQLAELDQGRLEQTCRDIIMRLVRPIAEEAEVRVNVGADRVQLHLDSEDSGLLIGREGQNLAAIQYLATRMISKAMEAQIKIQVDAGDYHSRQDVRLQELARNMAQKVRISGRSMSTKPLSAYQRRVIHLALQDAPDVQTRSTGEGALKRVVVMRRKDS